MRTARLPALSLVLLLACATDAPEAPLGPTSPAPANKSDAAVHMKSHFMRAYQAKDAVVAGRIEAAQEPLKWMVEHDEGHAHDASWEPHLQAMRDAARPGVGATDIATVAQATAAMAGACGSCHVALGKGPTFEGGALPEQEGDVKAHMARHLWAADRLWEGLLGPSDEAWANGTAELAEVPLHAEDGSIPPEVEALAERVHALGSRAAEATTQAERVAVVGDLLTTCGACHVATGAGPKRGGGGPG